MLARLIKPVLLSLAVFAAVWLLMFSYWQYTARMPSTGDIMLWLLALPVLLLAGYVLVRRLRSSPSAGAADTAAALSSRAQPAAGSAAAEKTDAAEARFQLAVLASGLRAPHGPAAADLAAAILEGKGPEPDAELRNEAGFPIFASRIEGLEIDELREQLAELPLAKSGEIDIGTVPEERLRTMQSMSEVLTELLIHAAEALATASPALVDHGTAQATTIAPMLRVSLMLPGWWTEHERLLAAQWLQQLSVQEAPGHVWQFDHFSAGPETGAWALLDRINLTLNRDATKPALWIVLAGESAISASRVAQWEAKGLLHLSERKPGLIPGEAVAGMLVTSATDMRHSKPDAVRVSRPAFGRLESAADAARVSSATLLGTLADRLLTTAELKIDAVQWMVSDADHRASRVTEVANLLRDKLPHVPFDSNNFFVGATCAHMGAAGDLVGLAMGCHLALEKQATVLVGSVQDAHARAALLVRMPPAA
jgi:hypothetical protein